MARKRRASVGVEDPRFVAKDHGLRSVHSRGPDPCGVELRRREACNLSQDSIARVCAAGDG